MASTPEAGKWETEMAFFSNTDPTNTRRFALIDADLPVVLAVYDYRRGFNLYSEVGTDEAGAVCFVSEPRSYFNDQVEEIDPLRLRA
jgi:hypothetical protein